MLNGSIQEESIGFVGIGEIGFGMAKSALDAGFTTIACDLREDALQAFADHGGETMAALDELARNCRIVHLVVVTDKQVDEVVRGPSGLFAGFDGKADDNVIVVHSSVQPETCEALAEDAPNNVYVIDAPVSGGESRAKAGDLTMMVGGDDAAIEFCRPVLEVVARDIFELEGVGSGQIAKLAHNTTAISNLMTTAEGLELGAAHGIARETLLDLFESGAADSAMLRQYRAVFAGSDDIDSERTEQNAAIAEKDLYHALEIARDTDVELTGAAVASQTVPRILTGYSDDK